MTGIGVMGTLIAIHAGKNDASVQKEQGRKTTFESVNSLYAMCIRESAMEKLDTSTQDYQEKKQAIQQFFESFENTNITYTVQTQKYFTNIGRSMGVRLVETDEYIITFQQETQERFDALDKQVLHSMYMDYFNDEKHSFTVAVLMMAEASPFRPSRGDFGTPIPPYAILRQDKGRWIQTHKLERESFLKSYFYSLMRINDKAKNEETETSQD